MKKVFIGDIVGRSGREALKKYIPMIKNDFDPDIIIVNAENAAAGYGLTEKIAEEIFLTGVDAITLGNHSWDQREMLSYVERNNKKLFFDSIAGRHNFFFEIIILLFRFSV